jgi:hypothetical protein
VEAVRAGGSVGTGGLRVRWGGDCAVGGLETGPVGSGWDVPAGNGRLFCWDCWDWWSDYFGLVERLIFWCFAIP